MKNNFESTFGDNEGRPPHNNDGRIEKHKSRGAEDRWSARDPGNSSEATADMANVQDRIDLIIQTGGHQGLQLQYQTCEDFQSGLGTFIQNNQQAIQDMHSDITKIISSEVMNNFHQDLHDCFSLFQQEVNQSIDLLNSQKKRFGNYMELLKKLMKKHDVKIPTNSLQGGLSDATQAIIDENK